MGWVYGGENGITSLSTKVGDWARESLVGGTGMGGGTSTLSPGGTFAKLPFISGGDNCLTLEILESGCDWGTTSAGGGGETIFFSICLIFSSESIIPAGESNESNLRRISNPTLSILLNQPFMMSTTCGGRSE